MPRKSKPSAQRTQFGKNVARLRYRARLTQGQFAEQVGLTIRFVQQIEAGDNWPSIPKLARFHSVLQCSWEDLMSGIISISLESHDR